MALFKMIMLEGPATIYEVAAHREALREALADGKNLRIDLGNSGKWDLAGLQLLISCIKTAEHHGLQVQLTGVPKVLPKLPNVPACRTGSRPSPTDREIVDFKVKAQCSG